ncbi:MAG: ribosome-associated translation inhibitor RaiA, partial [Myxococcota bacterium]
CKLSVTNIVTEACMQFSVTFRHMEATEALKLYARERLGKIKKYFPDPIAVNVVMSTERGYQNRVDVTLLLHNGLTVAGHETTENMYSSIDLVAAKIERQVRRYKDKLRAHKVKHKIAPIAWSHSVIAEAPPEATEEAEAEPAVVHSEPAAASASAEQSSTDELPLRPPVVIRTEQMTANPMTVEEAIMQMNLMHRQFFVFRHEKSGSVNVVYRREDDSYGVIETTPPAS